jgi:hypothetical protein
MADFIASVTVNHIELFDQSDASGVLKAANSRPGLAGKCEDILKLPYKPKAAAKLRRYGFRSRATHRPRTGRPICWQCGNGLTKKRLSTEKDEADQCSGNTKKPVGRGCRRRHYPPSPRFIFSVLGKRSDDSLMAGGCVGDKPCIVTIDSGWSVTTSRSQRTMDIVWVRREATLRPGANNMTLERQSWGLLQQWNVGAPLASSPPHTPTEKAVKSVPPHCHDRRFIPTVTKGVGYGGRSWGQQLLHPSASTVGRNGTLVPEESHFDALGKIEGSDMRIRDKIRNEVLNKRLLKRDSSDSTLCIGL